MARRLDFPRLSSDDWQHLCKRQEGLCAVSGEPLNETAELHHIVPAGHGGQQNAETDEFVRDFRQNGVLVNREITLDAGGSELDASPHLHAHGGNYNGGAAPPFDWYKHSHGSDMLEHGKWARAGNEFLENKLWCNTPNRENLVLGDTQSSQPDDLSHVNKTSGNGTMFEDQRKKKDLDVGMQPELSQAGNHGDENQQPEELDLNTDFNIDSELSEQLRNESQQEQGDLGNSQIENELSEARSVAPSIEDVLAQEKADMENRQQIERDRQQELEQKQSQKF